MRLTVPVPNDPAAPVIPSNKELFGEVQPVFPSQPAQPLQPAPKEEVTDVMKLKDSKFVRLTAKEAKNLELPEYLQLELDLNPLKEGETISADQDNSIRHAGKP